MLGFIAICIFLKFINVEATAKVYVIRIFPRTLKEKLQEAALYFFLLVQKVKHDQLQFMIIQITQCLTVALWVSAFQNV